MGMLDGKVVLVRGGTQGLGEATVRAVVREGATGVVVVGRDAAKGAALAAELSSDGTRVVYVQADMADVAAPARIVDAVRAEFGVAHGLVNVAASTGRDNVWTADPDGWDTMMAVNVRAPFFLLQGLAELMRGAGVRGSVVNIGSAGTAVSRSSFRTACRRAPWPP